MRGHSGGHAGVVAGPHGSGAAGRVRRLWEVSRGALPGVPRGADRGRAVPGATGAGACRVAGGARCGAVRGRGAGHADRTQGTGALALAGPLGTALAGAVRAGGGDGPVLVVPVPSARRAVRARGHDPARRIALAAAGELRRTGTSARVAGVLRQRRAVADQSGLDSRQRLGNLAGALEVAAGGARLLGGGVVVLVDDLTTTGASLAEAARAVREARDGWAAVSGEFDARRMAKEARRTQGETGMVDVDGGGDMIRAAVVAAPPDSFQINRN